MAKGDDMVRRRKNKTNRKRARNSESAVSARVAAIIAAKRRRKDGKRRTCEGMCYSLPTPDDPFNDFHGKKSKKTQREPDTKKSHPVTGTEGKKKQNSDAPAMVDQPDNDCSGGSNAWDSNYGSLSKFLILCLNAIQDAWKEQEEGCSGSSDGSLLAFDWGVEFWKRCSSGSHIIESSGACACKKKLAWLVSTASDIITRKEKQGNVIASPFLLFLVPTKEKAMQVRSICKPFKSLGIHTVSLHPSTPLDHQVHGLKGCEPEFLVSTPERLLELVSLKAIDISGVSLLVLDELGTFLDLGLLDKISSVRESVTGHPQVVIFCGSSSEASASIAQNLLTGPVNKICKKDSTSD
ncbi:uncharacterized protein LOC122052736 [Zingiber officinale]|uniref:DEAD/DEAH-box helicase domain-containing protein n=1 Tax=Zingiber officinale TaxID=94328 RepID=A0A8J5HHR1_ZINOF|nr:uncharacterized protein LOC122052736 [Zingiber officinale]XP_042470351.1 uncharacterized protein LOC122052736 [Zingiber officinale]KAG6522278.1 hypothetical protein ZIOFF_019416 [Zingiber officinale]